MTPQEREVDARLRELGIAFTRHEHPPVATVEAAERYWAGIDATHCKNLFLRDQKGTRHYLVILVALLPAGDPVLRYQQAHYERIVDLWPYAVFRRIDGTP